MSGDNDYVAIGRQKREQRDSRIPREWRIDTSVSYGENVIDVPRTCGILSDRELEITSNDAPDLVDKIRTKVLSAEEVTVAFCKRAAIAQQLTNCLTEIFFEEAIARAMALDEEQASVGDAPLRPLHGLPISLKDSFRIPGNDSTVGFVCWANQPDNEYSALPALLLQLGAVFYCKTNVPQTMMTADSDNNVFGRTLNPWNSRLTAGGSSGGEGALIAMRGSVLGVGTDIAGSVRIPSICNGIYGFRPSASIVPYAGQRSPAPPGMPGIVSVAGPMATTMRACTFFMKTIMEASPWRYDPNCLHQQWLSQSPVQKLRVGVIAEDGIHTPWPPVRRAMVEAVTKLQEAGVEIIHLTPPDVQEAITVTFNMFALDGGEFVKDLMIQGSEPAVQSVKNINLAAVGKSTLEDYFKLNTARSRIQKAYHNLWIENGLDAILIPGAPTTATPLDQWDSATYTALWNFLDYPAVIIPTGRIQEDDTVDAISNATHGERDERNYQLYTGPADFANAPLVVQVVGMRQEDEQLTQTASAIDRILNG